MKKIVLVFTTVLVLVLSGCGLFNNNDIVDYERSLLIVGVNSMYGLISQIGEEVVPTMYESIERCGSYYVAETDVDLVLYDTEGQELFTVNNAQFPDLGYASCPTDFVELDDDYILPFQSLTGKKGFIDMEGNKVIQAQYDSVVSYFAEEGIAQVSKGGYIGFIDQEGQEVVEFEYTRIAMAPKNGLIGVRKDGLYGFIDYEGNVVIGYEFTDIVETNDDVAVVTLNGRQGLIDLRDEGNVLIPFDYLYIMLQEQDFVIARNEDSLEGVINYDNEVLIDFIYQDIVGFTEYDKSVVLKDGFFGVIDIENEEIVAFTYSSLQFSSSGDYLLGIQENSHYFLNKYGAVLDSSDTKDYKKISQDSLVYVENGHYGLMSLSGDVILVPTYNYIYSNLGSPEDYFLYDHEDDQGNIIFGFINSQGEEQFSKTFELANNFNALGLAPVYDGEYWGYMDTSGTIVVDMKYDFVERYFGYN
jgi:hypothetical protein